MRNLISIFVLAFSSCVDAKKQDSISILNNSNQFIDSIAIHANDTIIKFYKISIGATFVATVPSGAIKGGHDIKITPSLYFGGKAVQCSNFYDDLGGFQGNYKMIISKDLDVKWSWKTE